MVITVIFSASMALDLTVPDDFVGSEVEFANEWFDAHFAEVASGIDAAEIYIESIE